MPSPQTLVFDAVYSQVAGEIIRPAPQGGLAKRIAAELRTAYPDVAILTSSNGLSIPQVADNGYSVSLIILENEVFYLNLGLAEFEVQDRQMAMDLLVLGCSRECRLRTTHIGGRLRDWFLDVQSKDHWCCIHSGGFARFSPWRTITEEYRMNDRPLADVGKQASDRLLRQLHVAYSEPGAA